LTGCRGKPKAMANAAFLGKSPRYRQKYANCCMNVTNLIRKAVGEQAA
jgi:hypothetical protein